MSESAARVERLAIPAAASYTWKVPQKPIAVSFPLDIIDRLEHEVIESFRSLSSRGSEAGGILYGKIEPGVPALVHVLSYDPVPCDYSRGPLYRLSDTDLLRFSQVMETERHDGLLPVGFYRGHTRKGLSLDPEDVLLLDSKFRDPHAIALLIRPFGNRPSRGGIFFRENGSIRTESSWLEFPFRASELADVPGEMQPEANPGRPTGSPPAAPKTATRAQVVPIASFREIAAPPPPPIFESSRENAPETKLAAEPTPVSGPATPSPTSPTASLVAGGKETTSEATGASAEIDIPGNSPQIDPEPSLESPPTSLPSRKGTAVAALVVTAVLAIAAVGLFVYPGYLRRTGPRPAATVQDTSPLALRVEHNGPDLVLTWNRNAAALRNATHAILSITDGQQHENVEMDLAQLRTAGSISYSPITADVVFRMDVTGPDQAHTTSESVRVLTNRPSPLDRPQPEANLPPAAGSASPTPSSPAQTADSERPAETARPEGSVRTLRPFNPESLAQRLHPVRVADLPAVPALPQESSSSSVAALNLGGTGVVPPPPPPPAAPPVAQNAPQPSPGQQNAAPPSAILQNARVGGQIQQAQLIRRKDPEYPRLARDAGARGTVELLATIGTDGKVKSVQVIKGHPLLQRSAVDAVKQWVYRPTLLNGVPVESQTQIFLNFVGDR